MEFEAVQPGPGVDGTPPVGPLLLDDAGRGVEKVGMASARRFSASGAPPSRASLRFDSARSRASASDTSEVLPSPIDTRPADEILGYDDKGGFR